MFEKRHEQLLPIAEFRLRLMRFAGLALAVTLIWWTIGIIGYHFLDNLDWVDAVLNAAMIAGGMGPVDPLTTPAAKLFASVYALLSGIVIIGVVGLLYSPVVHRIYHNFHITDEGEPDDTGAARKPAKRRR